ncbi:MAG: hypothetical protein FWD53_03540, partial [Phycisphaerales bacterium]|nr:hypothetical protein [Phycisphaerales bacterium]
MMKFPENQRQRGTVLVLVVATLALLTVIGTVYLITSRTEKATASATATGINLIWAQRSVMNSVVSTIGDAMYDNTAGQMGGYKARRYDYPDATLQPWLARGLHTQKQISGLNNPEDSDYSFLTANTNHEYYDPSDPSQLRVLGRNFTNGLQIVGDLPYQPPSALYSDQTNDGDRAWGYEDGRASLLPFSDGSGIRYRWGVRIIDTSRMLNLNTGSVEPPGANVLDRNGTYLTSIRLTGFTGSGNSGDMPAKENHNIFHSDDTAYYLHAPLNNSAMGRAGTEAASGPAENYDLERLEQWQSAVLQFEKPPKAFTFFDLSDELALRAYGQLGMPYHCRPAMAFSGPNGYMLWPNTLSNRRFLANGNPTTDVTGSAIVGNPRRRSYTTFSVSRDIRPVLDPINDVNHPVYTLAGQPYPGDWKIGFPAPGGSPTNQANVWPVWPAKVAANPILSQNASNGDGKDAAFYIAMAATNIATAMENSEFPNRSSAPAIPGFSREESRAFAANYVTARSSYMQQDTTLGNSYYLPNGPSFVDKTGICVRGGSESGGKELISIDFTGLGDGAKTYLGYAAQPFINEVAVVVYQKIDKAGDPPDPPKIIVKASAIELFNPYPIPLKLKGEFALQIENKLITFDGNDSYIPEGGYFVIYSNDGEGFEALPDGPTVKKQFSADFAFPSSDEAVECNVLLLRKYVPRSGQPTWAPIDYTNCTNASDGKYLIPDVTEFEEDDEDDQVWSIERKSKGGEWSVCFAPTADRQKDKATLGLENAEGGNPSIKLYDRLCTQDDGIFLDSQGQVYQQFNNIADFNRLMRIGHSFDAAGADLDSPYPQNPPTNYKKTLISYQLVDLYDLNLPPEADNAKPFYQGIKNAARFDNEHIEAQLHFDFYTNPKIFGTNWPDDFPNGDTEVNQTDPRALKLLEQLTFIDRVSDPTINIGSGELSIDKLRLMGQINVNTAAGDILRCMPGIHKTDDKANNIVGNILAYRARRTTSEGSGNPNYPTAGGKNYSDTNDYGDTKGIRSLAELIIPVSDAVGENYDSLDARDKAWASIYNLCTVRSDSFVVYGYLEAIKVNPRYASTHNNSTDWYDTRTPNGFGILQ